MVRTYIAFAICPGSDLVIYSPRTLYFDTGKPLTDKDRQGAPTIPTLLELHSSLNKPRSANEAAFESRLLILGEFHSVEGFGKVFNEKVDPKTVCPSRLKTGCNLHLFKDQIRPVSSLLYACPDNI